MGSPVSDSPALPGALKARVAASLDAPMAPPVRAYAGKLAEEASARAVLFYGSNLRTGELEGVLDFYVLLPGPQESGIWPRVSYHEWDHDGQVLRAKVATMHLATFHAAAAGDLLDTTIWARFVQPCALAWVRDEAARATPEERTEAHGGSFQGGSIDIFVTQNSGLAGNEGKQ